MTAAPGSEPCAGRWRLPPRSGAIRWRQWDDEVVAWVDATGSTHLLSPAASSVFATLTESPFGLTLQQIADDWPKPPGAGELASLRVMLLELERLGLLQQVSE